MEDAEMKSDNQNSGDDWVRLESTDGFSYTVKRKVAMASGTLRSMLDTESGFGEALSKTCAINERGAVVEKVCEYMAFKTYYDGVGSKEEIPVNEFMERIPPEFALEILLAADYLEGSKEQELVYRSYLDRSEATTTRLGILSEICRHEENWSDEDDQDVSASQESHSPELYSQSV